MAAMLGLDDDAVRAACAEAAQGASRRGGELQLARPGRDRRPRRLRSNARSRARQGAGCEAGSEAPGERAVPLALIGAGRERSSGDHLDGNCVAHAPRSGGEQRGRGDARRAGSDQGRARAPAGPPGALGRLRAGDRGGRARRTIVECGPGKVLAGWSSASTTALRERRSSTANRSASLEQPLKGSCSGASTGQIALVTGASRGIGAGDRESRSRAPARPSSAPPPARPAPRRSASACGGADRRTRAACSTWSTAPQSTLRSTPIEQEFGAVSILVNNAGITRDNLLLRMKDEDWDDDHRRPT